MLFRIEQRTEPSASMRIGAPVIAILLTLITSSIMFGLLGQNPFAALHAFFIQPLTSINGVSEWLFKASPLILIGCGLAIGFRANVWNIGAEGQLIMGAIAAAGVGLFYPDPESPLLLPMMIAAGMLGGMAWAAILTFLRARMNTNEILVTLMLTYVATLFLSLLVHGPWRDPDGFNYPQTALLPNTAMFELFDYAYRLNTSIVITVIAVIAMWIFTERSFFGYKMSVGGAAPMAARYAGFKESGSIWAGLLISGGAAGIEGMMLVGAAVGVWVSFAGFPMPIAILSAVLGGALVSLLFAMLALTFLTNQYAAGLALAIFGTGVSAFIGRGFGSTPIEALKPLDIPVLSDIPLIGPLFFSYDALVYFSFFLFGLITWFLYRTKAGLVVRTIGESPDAAHAIGRLRDLEAISSPARRLAFRRHDHPPASSPGNRTRLAIGGPLQPALYSHHRRAGAHFP